MADNASQQNTKLISAVARNLRISPRKVRLVTNLVKGMRASDALTQLQFTHKKASRMVAKAIGSAVANAENNFSVAPEQLFVKSITADMGRTQTRFIPRARGSAAPIKRRSTHVSVVLEERKAATVKKSRFQLLRRKKAMPENIEAQASASQVEQKTPLPQTAIAKPPAPVKTSEQKKENWVQQKRRLFNRKSGE